MSTRSLQVVLQKIGLLPKEIIVYLASLQHGPSAAAHIANQTDLNRSTTYVLFNQLIEKGIAYKLEEKQTTKFGVLAPEALIDYIEREKRELIYSYDDQKSQVQDILPELQSLQHISTTRPKVQFYEGKKGMREAYELTLQAKGDLRAYANVEEVHKGLPNFFPEYYLRRKSKQIFMKAIFTDNLTSRKRAEQDSVEYRMTKFIPEEKYSFSPEMNIWDDKILIVSWKERMAVIITSREIADLQRNTFDLLWDFL